MCDLAWVMLCERIRTVALADRAAYLLAGEDPPDPEALVAEVRDLIYAEPDPSQTPEMRRLRRLLNV